MTYEPGFKGRAGVIAPKYFVVALVVVRGVGGGTKARGMEVFLVGNTMDRNNNPKRSWSVWKHTSVNKWLGQNYHKGISIGISLKLY